MLIASPRSIAASNVPPFCKVVVDLSCSWPPDVKANWRAAVDGNGCITPSDAASFSATECGNTADQAAIELVKIKCPFVKQQQNHLKHLQKPLPPKIPQ